MKEPVYYRIFRKHNYFVVINEDTKTYWEEVCNFVRVGKEKETSTTYTIEFLRDVNVPIKFEIAFDKIRDENGNPYASTAVWENWYSENIGSSAVGTSVVPQMFRTTTTGSIVVPIYAITVINTGEGNGEFNGAILKPGEGVNFASDGIVPFAANLFSYDATDTEFLISCIQ